MLAPKTLKRFHKKDSTSWVVRRTVEAKTFIELQARSSLILVTPAMGPEQEGRTIMRKVAQTSMTFNKSECTELNGQSRGSQHETVNRRRRQYQESQFQDGSKRRTPQKGHGHFYAMPGGVAVRHQGSIQRGARTSGEETDRGQFQINVVLLECIWNKSRWTELGDQHSKLQWQRKYSRPRWWCLLETMHVSATGKDRRAPSS